MIDFFFTGTLIFFYAFHCWVISDRSVLGEDFLGVIDFFCTYLSKCLDMPLAYLNSRVFLFFLHVEIILVWQSAFSYFFLFSVHKLEPQNIRNFYKKLFNVRTCFRQIDRTISIQQKPIMLVAKISCDTVMIQYTFKYLAIPLEVK